MLYLLFEATRDWLLDMHIESAFSVLDELLFRASAAAGISFAMVLIFGRRTIRWLTRMKIGDAGLSDAAALKTHAQAKANVPTMGGILIIGAILAGTLLMADLREFYVQLGLIVAAWLSVLGGFDDWLKLTAKSRGTGSRQGLYAWEKLIFQLGLGLLVGWFLYRQGLGDAEGAGQDLRHVLNLPFQKTYDGTGLHQGLIFLPAGVFVVVAMLMVTGMSNAANITDGMDGLAAGVSTAVMVGLFVLSLIAGAQGMAQYLLVPYIPGADELAVLAGATAGACLGFLWWNCSPAQVFMGDTGSLALGGIAGYIAVVTRQEIATLIMSGVFLVEIASVAMQVGFFKATKGRRIFRCAPYHHHLHLGGWTEQQVVARAWIVTIILVVVALALVKVR
ncbi:MAG: phospho-N-acetylmuramoyl-pentapeptide-transferase [Phycisphaerales bacterium]